MINSVYGKKMENIRNHRDINIVILVITKKQISFRTKISYNKTYISENLLIIEMKKTEVKMNKPIYLALSVLDIAKTLMYEFWQ